MRILLTTDPIGGVWTFTKDLTQELLRRGHAVALVSFGREVYPWQREWVGPLESEHRNSFFFICSPVPLEWMEENRNAYDEGASLLVGVARDFDADVLHFNQYCYGALPTDLPKLVTAHSDVLSWAAACRPKGLGDSEWLTQYCRQVQRGLDGATAITAPTQWMLNALRTGFIVSCDTEVIHNGRGLHSPGEQTARLLRAVSVGRFWDEAKALCTLLEIDSPIPILVAGLQTFSGEDKLRDFANIQSLGQLSEQDILNLLSTSSVYIATSLYEPFGLAPLEAAQCGCAIVARDLPSLREVWGNAALYFTDGDSLQYVLAMLAETPEVLRDAQHRASSRAKSFTARRMATEYIDTYQQLIRAGSKSNKEVTINAA